jgi:glutamine amidotransferase
MITLVDYGVGNIQAFLTTFKRLGIPAERARTAEQLAGATRVILPGVGAFDHAMTRLNGSGMRATLEELVLGRKVPVVGICVGMQMLATGSDEGSLEGLNWVPGRVRSFSSHASSASLPMPHMGWNDLDVRPGGALFEGMDAQPRFYFLHSYYFECVDAADIAATARYGLDFACAISRGHIHGVQCHPEKSHHFGEQLLANFARG